MTEQERFIIETILADVGLETLCSGTSDQNSQNEPLNKDNQLYEANSH
ncbi:hypothetical protein [Desulfosporosinus sp. FKB]|nr:hypothetical protein [Desulfosporosinus sp. FKB]